MAGGSGAYQLYVGIDIAAETFTAAWRTPAGTPTAPFTGEQTPTGFAALQRRLATSRVGSAEVLVAMEATGCDGRKVNPLRLGRCPAGGGVGRCAANRCPLRPSHLHRSAARALAHRRSGLAARRSRTRTATRAAGTEPTAKATRA